MVLRRSLNGGYEYVASFCPLAVTVLILFGLAGCFAAQLSQGRQQGCDVKIWNEYQYFTIRPAEDTAFM